MDDWVSINVIDGSHDAVLEFLFGSHADVAQNGAGELPREEALDQVGARSRAWALKVKSKRPGGRVSSRRLGFPSKCVRNDCRGSA